MVDFTFLTIQLLIVDDDLKKEGKYYMSEIYHPSINSHIMFKRHFGIWSENYGLEIPERDLYKRRFDMKNTDIKIIYNVVCISFGPKQFCVIILMHYEDQFCLKF